MEGIFANADGNTRISVRYPSLPLKKNNVDTY
jgi:hypothetical protein